MGFNFIKKLQSLFNSKSQNKVRKLAAEMIKFWAKLAKEINWEKKKVWKKLVDNNHENGN